VHVIIVDRATKTRLTAAVVNKPTVHVVTGREYIASGHRFTGRDVKVINLSRDYAYLDFGYYCSLLAEARGHRVIPPVETILDLSSRHLYRFALSELDEDLERGMARLNEPPPDAFDLHIFFGRSLDSRFKRLARRTFDMFRCPLLKLRIEKGNSWHVRTVKPLASRDIPGDLQSFFDTSLEEYTRVGWREPAAKPTPRYYVAILHNPKEQLPPSSPRTLQKFIRVGESMGLEVELIERKDYFRLAEFEALFIRETTAIDNHTYRFAKKADYEDMVVIDDPTSIVRCTNKVYLAELLRTRGIRTPKTIVFDKEKIDVVERELSYPMVLKVPDGSFSRGVVKVENRQQLETQASTLLDESDVILAQEFVYTPYDWRVCVFNGKPLYAAQYFMSRKHWQIVQYSPNGKISEGPVKTYRVEDAPQAVVEMAVRAAALIGNGLYGVDLKQTDDAIYVMEINDNPSIDTGYEDAVLGDELYRQIWEEFIRRLEARSAPAVTAAQPAPAPAVPIIAQVANG
jgi:glutathione synthase/RimK-type ligase-like ATP-grasp enzyme